MFNKKTLAGFRITRRETLSSNEAIDCVETKGLPGLPVWKKLFVDMPRRSAVSSVAGVVLGGGNVLRHTPSLYSAIIGLGTFAAVYLWTGPEQNLPK